MTTIHAPVRTEQVAIRCRARIHIQSPAVNRSGTGRMMGWMDKPGPRFVLLVGILMVLLSGSGCSTLSSLGLPLAVGPHRMLRVTQQMHKAAAHPAPWPRELAKDVLPQYLIEPGDLLLVEATDFDSPVRLPGGDQIVQPDGTIDLGRYGRVFAAGKSIDEVQDEVRAEIKRKSDEPTGPISVRLVGWDSKVVYVLGEVSSPGSYPFTGRETALDAILAAGDLTSRANRHKIILSRPTGPDDCRLVLPVCYDHIVQLGDTSSNYQLLPGDRIFVASMTLLDDLLQTISPQSFENCPRCKLAQRACHVTH
jgi:polysaccharide biosynthesis/export protein